MVPLRELPKQEIVYLDTHFCGHGHRLIEHRSCYKRGEERIGFLDIETSALDMDYGIVLCYCIKVFGKSKIYENSLLPKDIKRWGREGKEDTRVLRELVKDLYNFDRLIGHNTKRFDIPALRTRAVMCSVKFPEYGAYTTFDTLVGLWQKFKLSRNGLGYATDKLFGSTEKNHLSIASKHECLRGKKWALDFTLDHCRRDVRDTERIYNVISPYFKLTKSSI